MAPERLPEPRGPGAEARFDGMGDLAAAPPPARRGARHCSSALAARRARHRTCRSGRGVPPRRARVVPAAVGALGLRPHRPALRERVRRPRRPRRRYLVVLPGARRRSSSARRCSRASSSTARTASPGRRASRGGAGCSRRRCSSRSATVARRARSERDRRCGGGSPFDALEGRMSPSGFEIEGLVVPAYALFALALGVLAGAAPAPDRRRDVGGARRLRRRPPGRARSSSGRTTSRRCTRPSSRPTRAARARLGAERTRSSTPSAGTSPRRARTSRSCTPSRPRIDPQEYLLSLGWRRARLLPARPTASGRSRRSRPGSSSCWPRCSSSRRCGSSRGRRRDAHDQGSRPGGGCSRLAAGLPPPARRCPQALPQTAAAAVPAAASALAVRLRQPRDDEPVLRPDRYGIQDACALFGATCAWTGSGRSDVGEMVDGDAAGDRRNGATGSPSRSSTRRRSTSRPPTALEQRHPGRRLQRRRRPRQQAPRLRRPGPLPVGARSSAPGSPSSSASGDVFLFIATPGQLNIQPRVDGALDAIRDSGKPIRARTSSRRARRPSRSEPRSRRPTCDHKRLRGMFAVDGGSTQGVAEVMRKYRLHAARRPRRRLRPAAEDAAARSPTATSTSRSTSSRTSRASCRSSSSSSPATRAASSRRRTRTPGSTSSPARTSGRT